MRVPRTEIMKRPHSDVSDQGDWTGARNHPV